MIEEGSAEMLKHYSAALDEIYRLRASMAYEARVIEAHLELKSFPKSRRGFAENQVQRMRSAARGDAEYAYLSVGSLHTSWQKQALESAGADECLTRHAWENRSGDRP